MISIFIPGAIVMQEALMYIVLIFGIFNGLWESLHNPAFNRVQFDTFKFCV